MPDDIKDVIELKVGDSIYGGWLSVMVDTGIEQIAGAFELGITERWPGQDTYKPIKRGESCTLLMNGQAVITGYVDDVNIDFDANTHTVNVTGRDKTGDLVDCAAIHKTGQWNGHRLDQIVRDICAPFGIKVIVNTDMGKALSTFSLQEGETAYEAIERACRMAAVLPISDGLGNLVLTRAASGSPVASLIEGENILTGRGEFSIKERFSVYLVKSQDRGSDDDFDADTHTQVSARATDDFVKRYRPTTIIAEDRGAHASMQQRAEWEKNVRRGRSARATIGVVGWRHGNGLWQKNTMVHLTSPLLGANADLLVASVKYTQNDQGKRSEITLTGREAFDLIVGIKSTRLERAIKGKNGAAQSTDSNKKNTKKTDDWTVN